MYGGILRRWVRADEISWTAHLTMRYSKLYTWREIKPRSILYMLFGRSKLSDLSHDAYAKYVYLASCDVNSADVGYLVN